MSKQILFVCTGNSCRSPMAEYWLKTVSGNSLVVHSGGTKAVTGSPASWMASMIMREHGIDITGHYSRSLMDLPLENFHLILAMEPKHRDYIREKFPRLSRKCFLFKSYALGREKEPVTEEMAVADPFMGGYDDYRKICLEIKELSEEFWQRLNTEKSLSPRTMQVSA